MRILTGIQPSGKLHVGNYFGAMRPMLDRQSSGDMFWFIANYHALTTVTDPDALRRQTWDVALDYLACGLDPEKTVFYRQSDVPEVQELAWLLSIVTPMGLLERCHSYKDKMAKGFAPSHGLFAYPVLMAADILIMQSDLVPVGKDQKQHLEVTRDIAIKFNNLYGETFKIPDAAIAENVAVVPGTDGQKMSKSYGNTIELFGDPKAAKKRIMSIVTDSTPLEAPKNPDTCNVFKLYSLFATPEQAADLAARYRAGNFGYGTAKKELAALFEERFAPLREKRAALAARPDEVEDILRAGAEKARAVARQTLAAARKAVGLD
jgi:tryptophanyl-tRNA synthetase